MENIVFQYPSWYLLLCVLLGAVYAIAMYLRDGKFEDQSRIFKFLLAFLRGSVISLLSMLLLSPLIKTLLENQKNPIILVMEDASASVDLGLGSDKAAFQGKIDAFCQSLSDKYDLKRFQFGDKVRRNKEDSIQFQISNLSNAVEYLSDNFGDQNVGAVILASDGIFNEGMDPIYQRSELTAPIYSIALGDTTQRKDLILKDAFHNKIVYLGDQFNVQLDIAANNCSNQASQLTVTEVLENGTNKLVSERIVINKDDYFNTKEITLDAKRSGIIKYRIALSPISGESLKSNNVKEIYVEVLDARQKILLLANAPHPDLAALKSALLLNKNYEVELKLMGRDNFNASDYNAAILHNLPSRKHNIRGLIDQLKKKRIAQLFVVGRQTDVGALNQVQEVLKIGGNNSQSDEVQGIFRSSFNSFTLDEAFKNKISKLPPLTAPFGKYTAGAKCNVLLYQKIGRVETEYPLLSFAESNNTKTGVLSAEGIWKWKLNDYLEHNNHDAFNILISKVMQFVSIKDDKRKFRVEASKNVFKENETVRLEAQLFNDNYETINTPDVFLSLIDPSKKEFQYTFSKKENYYNLDLGYLKEGNYKYSAKVNYNGKESKAEGKFSVKAIQLEQFDLTARHDVMFRLSDRSGGKLYYPNQLEALQNSILESDKIKPIIYTSNKTQSILNIRWILGLLILLLIIEWFLRRYFGSY